MPCYIYFGGASLLFNEMTHRSFLKVLDPIILGIRGNHTYTTPKTYTVCDIQTVTYYYYYYYLSN